MWQGQRKGLWQWRHKYWHKEDSSNHCIADIPVILKVAVIVAVVVPLVIVLVFLISVVIVMFI